MDYKPHELSLAFPDMSADQYRRLVEDVRANGLLHEIVLFEGAILDGRHRYAACMDADVSPRFREYEGADPVSYVTSENAARRHLSASQLAHAVAAMAGWEREAARKRQGERSDLTSVQPCTEVHGRVSEKLAEKTGVSARTVDKAIMVRERGIPELNAKVSSGDITVNEAEKIARLKPAAQNRIVAIEDKKARLRETEKSATMSEAARVRELGTRAPRDIGNSVTPKFAAKFLGRMRMMLSGIREDLGSPYATQDEIVSAVLAGLSEDDAVSLKVASPLLGACAVIWAEAIKVRAA